MSKLIKAIAVALVIAIILSVCGFSNECAGIRESVLRLHVLANSDSEEDQALKLKVRDTITETAAGLFDRITTEGEALEQAKARLPELQAAAQQCVWDEGYDYTVRAELCDMYFTTRVYETVTLPAGMYDALRISIGEGEGRNWWCVVFPPMCVSTAVEHSELEDVLTPPQQDIVTQPQKYEVRFKIVEVIEEICNEVRSWFGADEAILAAVSEEPAGEEI